MLLLGKNNQDVLFFTIVYTHISSTLTFYKENLQKNFLRCDSHKKQNKQFHLKLSCRVYSIYWY